MADILRIFVIGYFCALSNPMAANILLIIGTSGAAIYLYSKASRLFDGSVAAGMRIGYFLEDDNVTGTPNLLTPEGLALFDRAVSFGLGGAALRLGGNGITADAPVHRLPGLSAGPYLLSAETRTGRTAKHVEVR